jgi:curved DNA-binding protein CbpA
MKRSLYEMFGLPRDADQTQIDSAFEALNVRLKPGVMRGDSDAVNDSILLKDGYQILSDPGRRAHYDSTLDGAKSGIAFLPEDTKMRSRLGLETMVLIVLATVLGGIVYHQLTKEMEVVRIEHQQAVSVKRAQYNSPAKPSAPVAAATPEKDDTESQ